jgi:nucleoside-diphosphate-sugar epimerase
LRILFLGGTGTISSACVPRVLAAGHHLTVLTRGTTTVRAIPAGVEVLRADIRDRANLRSAIGSRDFDVVVNFAAYTADHVESDVELFSGRTGQYVFISSASVYQKPPRRLPVTESTPLDNPYWQYARGKIACEQALLRAHQDTGFPITIVRPAQTYDRTSVPIEGGWTQVERMRRGLEVVVHGDGTSLWTLTGTVALVDGYIRHA